MPKISKINEENEVIGETTIKEAKENGWMRRIARVFVFDTDGRILLQRRGPNVVSFPDTWDQSAGGHVDLGESDIEAASRELREELGIRAELSEVATGHRSEDPQDRVFSSIYRTIVAPDTKFTPDPDEVSEVQWFTVNEFETLLHQDPQEFPPAFTSIWKKYRDTLIPK